MDSLGSEVARELSRFGPASGLAPIVDAWPGAVGPDIARNAWPARLGRDGSLHVHTSSSAWAFELAQLERRILDALGALAPRKLRFAVGPLPEPPADSAGKVSRLVAEPTARHRAHAEELAARIGDENLRKVVAKAAAAGLAEAESGRPFW